MMGLVALQEERGKSLSLPGAQRKVHERTEWSWASQTRERRGVTVGWLSRSDTKA